MLMAALWRLQVFNRHYEPATGSALYICNHQSFLDPPIMGLALSRPMNFMAREDLFRVPLFRWWIRSQNAFPVKRASADTGALKEALRRLKRGGQLVVFPEGTRTRDGSVGPFLPGVAMLARRAAEWVVPVTIEGAFEAWPRTQPVPLPGHIVVAYCRPMHNDQVRALGDEEFLATVRGRIVAMQAQIRRRRSKPPLGRGRES
jgi:1-acyl-sn-glycerol-3-phosphate acyltransferase